MSLLKFFWVASYFSSLGLFGHLLWAKSHALLVKVVPSQNRFNLPSAVSKPHFLTHRGTNASVFMFISPDGLLWTPLNEPQPKQVKSFVSSFSWWQPVETDLCQSGTATTTTFVPPASFQSTVATTTPYVPPNPLTGLWGILPGLPKSQPVQSVVEVRPSSTGNLSEVYVKNHLVAQLLQRSQAQKMAQRLEKVLKNAPQSSLDVKPIWVKGQPMLTVGTQKITGVNAQLAAYFQKSQEILAIEWSNNLRLALGLNPLSLIDAQTQIHSLQETPQKLAGNASWYGPYFHGRLTAAGETYNQNELTAAHPSLPFDTYLKVKNLKNEKQVIVRVNDRGPYVGNRVLDLSREAARCLESEKAGVVPVEVVIMGRGSGV